MIFLVDRWMRDIFVKCSEEVNQFWTQFNMTTEEVADIVKMSSTDCSQYTQDDLVVHFPAYDMFLFLKFDALCTGNHYIEGSFSNKGSLLRDNLSDERIDRKARYRQNLSHHVAKKVVNSANKRMESKGCKGTTKSAFKTRNDVQQFIQGHLQILDGGYASDDFAHPDCPSNTSHRNSVDGQITARDR